LRKKKKVKAKAKQFFDQEPNEERAYDKKLKTRQIYMARFRHDESREQARGNA
jgi:hypothetical protein